MEEIPIARVVDYLQHSGGWERVVYLVNHLDRRIQSRSQGVGTVCTTGRRATTTHMGAFRNSHASAHHSTDVAGTSSSSGSHSHVAAPAGVPHGWSAADIAAGTAQTTSGRGNTPAGTSVHVQPVAVVENSPAQAGGPRVGRCKIDTNCRRHRVERREQSHSQWRVQKTTGTCPRLYIKRRP